MNLNMSLLKALTWGTCAAAILSALLLAALEPGWSDVSDVALTESAGRLARPLGSADPRSTEVPLAHRSSPSTPSATRR